MPRRLDVDRLRVAPGAIGRGLRPGDVLLGGELTGGDDVESRQSFRSKESAIRDGAIELDWVMQGSPGMGTASVLHSRVTEHDAQIQHRRWRGGHNVFVSAKDLRTASRSPARTSIAGP